MQGEDDLDFKIEIESPRENDKNNVQSIGSNDRKTQNQRLYQLKAGRKVTTQSSSRNRPIPGSASCTFHSRPWLFYRTF